MINGETREIALLLERYGNIKISIAEKILKRELSVEEREDLYFSAIQDNLYMVFKHRPEISPFVLATALQMEEMFGSDHIHFTKTDNHLDHEPTAEEIRDHYIAKRAPQFRERFNAIMEAEQAKKEAEIGQLNK